jgi:SRSO17 transposase
VVLMDAGYGNDTRLRTEITARGMSYAAGIGPNTSVWPLSAARVPPQPRSGRGRPQTRLQRDGEHQPISVKALALSRPQEAGQTITWREGSADGLASRFARRRVRPAHRDNLLSEPRAEEWLLIERPQDETEPIKYWFSSLSETVAFERLVDLTKLRWRIERDDQELKQELGLGDYEGRGWRGFHHHATLCIAAYGFLIAERGAIPPLRTSFRPAALAICHSPGYRPRGAADPTRTPHSELDRHPAATPHRHPRKIPPEMPLLQCADPQDGQDSRLLTQ